MVHFLIPGISRPYLDFPVKAANEENQDYCHKLVIRLHRVCCHFFFICHATVGIEDVGEEKKKSKRCGLPLDFWPFLIFVQFRQKVQL